MPIYSDPLAFNRFEANYHETPCEELVIGLSTDLPLKPCKERNALMNGVLQSTNQVMKRRSSLIHIRKCL